MKSFDLTIATPEKNLYHGKVTSLVAPSALGYLGVWADHAPLIAALTKGRIILREDSKENKIFESKDGGVLEVMNNNVTILL